MDDYGGHYGDESFWEKVKTFAVRAGKEVIEKALVLYYCLQDPDTPVWAKGVIVGTLGYFIVPLDAIPDLTPIVGFSDDLGALFASFAIVAAHVKPEHWDRALNVMRQWFGDSGEGGPMSNTSSVVFCLDNLRELPPAVYIRSNSRPAVEGQTFELVAKVARVIEEGGIPRWVHFEVGRHDDLELVSVQLGEEVLYPHMDWA